MKPPVPLVVRFADAEYDRLRKAAFDARRPMAELVREAVQAWLDQQQPVR